MINGPIIGMVLLFGLLQWRDPAEDAGVLRAADGILRHLQLFFVPAGVGIVTYLGLLRADALPIAGAMVEDETEGAFSGLSMGLTALATSILLPVLLLILR